MGGGGGGGFYGPSDHCVSPRPKHWVFGIFRLDFGSILGTWLDRGLGLGLDNYKHKHVYNVYFLELVCEH